MMVSSLVWLADGEMNSEVVDDEESLPDHNLIRVAPDVP